MVTGRGEGVERMLARAALRRYAHLTAGRWMQEGTLDAEI
jgi:hypothetical protein